MSGPHSEQHIGQSQPMVSVFKWHWLTEALSIWALKANQHHRQVTTRTQKMALKVQCIE